MFKMKELYLIYNQLSRQYIFISGKDPYSENREIWNVANFNGLLRKLKSTLNRRRKTILHLREVPEDYQARLTNFFEKTSIEVIAD